MWRYLYYNRPFFRLMLLMDIVLNRRKIKLDSGAGQLILMQAKELKRQNHRVSAWCAKGGLELLLRSGIWVQMPWRSMFGLHRISPQQYLGWIARKRRECAPTFFIDHGMTVGDADMVFVHNLLAGAKDYLKRDGHAQLKGWDAEQAFFARLGPQGVLVANSELVRQSLIRDYQLAPSRVKTLYPGFNSQRFNLTRCEQLREITRSQLGLTPQHKLVGLVTSGDFRKRGLDTFVECAERLAARDPNTRFLILGAKRLPEALKTSALVRDGKLHHQPASRDPAVWLSALDLFLYPARFEEFGMVVSEALAMGVPVLTSRRVGASEIIPPDCAHWVLPEPNVDALEQAASGILENLQYNKNLARSVAGFMRQYDDQHYASETLQLVEKLMVKSADIQVQVAPK